MRIGVDVSSGERPCEELVIGAIEAHKLFPNIFIYLIGRSSEINEILEKHGEFPQIHVVNATEVIGMDEHPAFALLRKKDSTVAVGCRLLKTKQIDVFFSPGSTGATVATSVLTLGLLPRIKKPAMIMAFPRPDGGETYLLDIGANPEPSEETLFQNAMLGGAYYNIACPSLRVPKIGLLNIGSESIKGSKNIKKAFSNMSKISKKYGDFIGNIEGYNIFNGTVDIGVCDGFTGNTILKFAEAMSRSFVDIIKSVVNPRTLSTKDKIAFAPVAMFGTKDNIKQRLKQKMTPRFFGAAPLLGVKGTVLVGHGMCSTADVTNAIALGKYLYDNNYLQRMNDILKKYD